MSEHMHDWQLRMAERADVCQCGLVKLSSGEVVSIAAHNANGGLVEALIRIAYDEDTVHLACSDLPYCMPNDMGEHSDDCAVAIARAALTALEQPSTGP
jgi:hypothetical protein